MYLLLEINTRAFIVVIKYYDYDMYFDNVIVHFNKLSGINIFEIKVHDNSTIASNETNRIETLSIDYGC